MIDNYDKNSNLFSKIHLFGQLDKFTHNTHSTIFFLFLACVNERVFSFVRILLSLVHIRMPNIFTILQFYDVLYIVTYSL